MVLEKLLITFCVELTSTVLHLMTADCLNFVLVFT